MVGTSDMWTVSMVKVSSLRGTHDQGSYHYVFKPILSMVRSKNLSTKLMVAARMAARACFATVQPLQDLPSDLGGQI